MARNEEKFKFINKISAQSTLEYALILPLLFLLVLAIFELAFLWHKFNSVEFVASEISANIATNSVDNFISNEKAIEIISLKTKILQERNVSFSVTEEQYSKTFVSNENHNGKPFVLVKIDYTPVGVNNVVIPSVQVQAVYLLRFFSASIPNYKTKERIIIIPDNVVLTSTKTVSVSEY